MLILDISPAGHIKRVGLPSGNGTPIEIKAELDKKVYSIDVTGFSFESAIVQPRADNARTVTSSHEVTTTDSGGKITIKLSNGNINVTCDMTVLILPRNYNMVTPTGENGTLVGGNTFRLTN